MPSIDEVATMTAKGQITLPRPIRRALGVDYRSQVVSDLRGTEVIASRADGAEHEEPAIGSFLALLEADIRTGKTVCALPDELTRAMLATLNKNVDLSATAEGDVEL